jgi:hypothetical protein
MSKTVHDRFADLRRLGIDEIAYNGNDPRKSRKAGKLPSSVLQFKLPPMVDCIEIDLSRDVIAYAILAPSTNSVTDVDVRMQCTVRQAPSLMVTEPEPAVAVPAAVLHRQ